MGCQPCWAAAERLPARRAARSRGAFIPNEEWRDLSEPGTAGRIIIAKYGYYPQHQACYPVIQPSCPGPDNRPCAPTLIFDLRPPVITDGTAGLHQPTIP